MAVRQRMKAKRRMVKVKRKGPRRHKAKSTVLFRCSGCGYPVARPGLCGECACEDDGGWLDV